MTNPQGGKGKGGGGAYVLNGPSGHRGPPPKTRPPILEKPQEMVPMRLFFFCNDCLFFVKPSGEKLSQEELDLLCLEAFANSSPFCRKNTGNMPRRSGSMLSLPSVNEVDEHFENSDNDSDEVQFISVGGSSDTYDNTPTNRQTSSNQGGMVPDRASEFFDERPTISTQQAYLSSDDESSNEETVYVKDEAQTDRSYSPTPEASFSGLDKLDIAQQDSNYFLTSSQIEEMDTLKRFQVPLEMFISLSVYSLLGREAEVNALLSGEEKTARFINKALFDVWLDSNHAASVATRFNLKQIPGHNDPFKALLAWHGMDGESGVTFCELFGFIKGHGIEDGIEVWDYKPAKLLEELKMVFYGSLKEATRIFDVPLTPSPSKSSNDKAFIDQNLFEAWIYLGTSDEEYPMRTQNALQVLRSGKDLTPQLKALRMKLEEQGSTFGSFVTSWDIVTTSLQNDDNKEKLDSLTENDLLEFVKTYVLKPGEEACKMQLLATLQQVHFITTKNFIFKFLISLK